jgi:hypothetical protein
MPVVVGIIIEAGASAQQPPGETSRVHSEKLDGQQIVEACTAVQECDATAD